MDKLLLPFPNTAAFVDDLNIKGHLDHWEKLWGETLRVFSAMAAAGFKLNLQKCKFLVTEAALLGLKVGRRVY